MVKLIGKRTALIEIRSTLMTEPHLPQKKQNQHKRFTFFVTNRRKIQKGSYLKSNAGCDDQKSNAPFLRKKKQEKAIRLTFSPFRDLFSASSLSFLDSIQTRFFLPIARDGRRVMNSPKTVAVGCCHTMMR